MIYFAIIIPLLVVYVTVISSMKRMTNTKIVNLTFCSVTYLFYILYLLKLASNVGIHNYYFYESLATANVSPFMFSIMPLVYFSRGRLQKYLYALVSLLSVGMLLSPVLNAVIYAIKGNTFGIIFAWDYVAHLSLSLWGVYLVKSGQVELTRKNSLVGSMLIFGVCGVMVVLNLIFDTSFFGLSLRGKHHIYYNAITSNSYLSATIFFIGFAAVLALGYFYCKYLSGSRKNTETQLKQ